MVARICVRPGDHEDGRQRGALILGAMAPGGPLKEGVVYQIEEVLGTLCIREVGPCALSMDRREGVPGSWQMTANDIIGTAGSPHLLTADEWATRDALRAAKEREG